MNANPRIIAFYLPQFHPIPENDDWWGKGFTEWTNVAKAKPLFKGHHQPNVPADLGFYDLRVPETRAAQAQLAKNYGVEAFCYYHYWFAGKRIIERPFDEVLSSGQPDFGFCLCWANQTWTGIWHGCPNRILIEQTYPGEQDHRDHFQTLLPAFQDPRYTRVEGKPLFLIYRPLDIPNLRETAKLWKNLAVAAGLPGLHLIGTHDNDKFDPQAYGLDGVVITQLPPRRGWVSRRNLITWAMQERAIFKGHPTIHDYRKVAPTLIPSSIDCVTRFPCVIPNWDNTPRSGSNGLVLSNSTPELFCDHFADALKKSRNAATDSRLIFLKSWNEWAEGNYLEPDLRYGLQYLEALREALLKEAANSVS